MGVCGMRNSPLVRTALFRHFKRSEISLRWSPEQNQMLRLRQLFFGQAKEGERQRSTPPQEPPVARAASIRTGLLCPKRSRPDGGIHLNARRNRFAVGRSETRGRTEGR